MTYRGHVKNGVVLLDEPASLPEGSAVEVICVAAAAGDEPPATGPTLYETLQEFIGVCEGPEDFAENHDHYIHGAPRRS